MLKKYLSIFLSFAILAGSVMGISLVNAGAANETKYYLFGDINGAYYSVHQYGGYYDYLYNYEEINLDEYNFEKNTLAVSFAEDSYVAIKDSNNTYFMTDGSPIEESASAVLYKTPETNIYDITKMLYIPAKTDVEFTITENTDGTLKLSYEFLPYSNDGHTKLEELLIAYLWDFEFTPEYWYDIYTKESYDAYLASKQKTEKLLYHEENVTDEEFKAMFKELKAAKQNLVRVNSTEPSETTVPTDTAEPPYKLFGDTNMDGDLNVKDATNLQLYLSKYVGIDEIDLSVCDVDGNGDINIQDATQIQMMLADFI